MQIINSIINFSTFIRNFNFIFNYSKTNFRIKIIFKIVKFNYLY